MTGVNIPPSIFAGAAQPFNTGSQPASGSGETWKMPGLQGLPSWQDRLTPAMDWQPDSAVLPLSSLPLSEASFGLSSLQSKQSLGEKVSLGSKQMALSVLDILNAKPPGPPSPPQGEPASGPAEQPEAGQPSSSNIPEARPLTAGLDRELSVRNLPDPVPMQSPSRLAEVAGPLTDHPPALQPPLAEMCSPSGRVLPPAQYPLFTQMPSPIPSSAFGMHDQQQQPASPSSGLRAHSLDPTLARSARGTRAGSAGLADGSVRRTTRAISTVAPAVQQPIKIELTPAAAPQTSGAALLRAHPHQVDPWTMRAHLAAIFTDLRCLLGQRPDM